MDEATVSAANAPTPAELVGSVPVDSDRQTHANALQKDPVAKLRHLANSVRTSQLKQEEFKEIIASINRKRALAAKEAQHRQTERLEAQLRAVERGATTNCEPEGTVELDSGIFVPMKDLVPLRDSLIRWLSTLSMVDRGLDLEEVS